MGGTLLWRFVVLTIAVDLRRQALTRARSASCAAPVGRLGALTIAKHFKHARGDEVRGRDDRLFTLTGAADLLCQALENARAERRHAR